MPRSASVFLVNFNGLALVVRNSKFLAPKSLAYLGNRLLGVDS